MRFFKAFVVLSFLFPALIGPRASSQANVVENENTFIYVDATNGSDSNSGALASPFKTIQAAINSANTLNRASTGVKVVVNPGTYREFVNVGGYNVTAAPLVIEAATSGTAILAGSDVLTGWAQESANVYSTSWIANLGSCAIPSGWPTDIAPITRRAEMVFVNGTPLTEVLSYSDLQPGTFYVDDTAKMMYVSPDASTNMASAVVEAATRPQTLNIASRTNVVVRGLVFRHAANCLNTSGAAVNGSNNVLIDGIQAVWNNWGGFGVFSSSNVTVQNSVANYNGGVGFMGNQDQTTLFSFDESDNNNWRGAQSAFYDWGMGGTKLFAMRSTTVKNHFAYNNQAEGLWFDTDNKNITVDNATLSGNLMAALQIERNEGPISIQNSRMCNSGTGVNVLTSQNLTVTNNTFYNNGGSARTNQAGIFVAGQAGGININDWQTGQTYNLFTTGMVLQGNTILDGASGQFGFGTYLTGTDWTQFATTLTAGSNSWYDPATTTSFKLVNGQKADLAGWQAGVGTDYSSAWTSPATSPVVACAPPSPTFKDFNIDADNRTYTMTSGKATSALHVNSFGYGAVNLRVSGVPTGVTATLSQQSLTSGAVTLTFVSSMAAVSQKAPITVWASSGSRVHSVTFYVQVVPASFATTVTWATPQAITYGTPLSAAQLNATMSVAGTCTYSPSAGTVLAAGTRTITATCTPTDAYNYSTPAPTTVSISVAKTPLTITSSSPTVVYGSPVPTIVPLFSGLVNGDTGASMTTQPTCKTSYTTTSLVTSSPSTGCWSAVSPNYSITYVAGTVKVVSASQTITFSQPASPVKFGAASMKLSATATSGLGVSFAGTAGVCTTSGSTLSIVGAGICTVTANQSGNSNYAAASPVTQTITVSAAPLTITASNPTVVYGAPVPTITASYAGFANGNSSASLAVGPVCSTTYTTTSAVGSSPATTCSGAASANYSISYVPGKVTVNKASTQTITFAQPVSPVSYGTSAFALSATANSGLAVSFAGTAGICTVSGSMLSIISAGTCTVTASQAGNTNYPAAANVTRTITVTPARLTITASSPAVLYGSAVPAITASYGGFVTGESSSSLTTAPACTTTYTTTSAAGSSPATGCSGAASNKYSISYVAGKVTVTAVTLPITAAPMFSLVPGTYATAQSVTISDATSGATIYYTRDGTNPTTNSTAYSGPIAVTNTLTLKAIAVANGYTASPIAAASYTITTPSVNFSSGFVAGGMQLNGKSALAGSVLQLTDGGTNEAASAFFPVPLNVSNFSTTFTVQQNSGSGDGMMFVIQNAAAGAKVLGPTGSSLGYSYGPAQAGSILNSLGVKFDLYSNSGEGANSTGLYLSGAQPTKPAIDLTPSGVDLHSGHALAVKLTYDGTTLSMAITDTVTGKSYGASWSVNIPQIVGSSTAYVGFTASTGGATAVQQVQNWKF